MKRRKEKDEGTVEKEDEVRVTRMTTMGGARRGVLVAKSHCLLAAEQDDEET
jgi:hypothetical protein